MIDQYKNETAQIHAPAALIEKTKAAVRVEEARIGREQVSQNPMPVSGVTSADYAAYQKKYFRHKWTYALTAAAAVVLLLSVSLAMRGSLSDRFIGGRTTADGAMMAEEAPADEDGTSAEMMEETESGAADSTAGEMSGGIQDSTADAAPEDMGNSMVSEDTAGAVSESAAEKMERAEASAEAPVADYAGEDTECDMVQEDGEKKEAKPFRTVKDSRLRIEAVEEKPPFYDNPETQDIVYEGLTFRVMQEEEGWMAYVETADGTAYVINGTVEELDSFLKEGFEELEKRKK